MQKAGISVTLHHFLLLSTALQCTTEFMDLPHLHRNRAEGPTHPVGKGGREIPEKPEPVHAMYVLTLQH